MGEEIQAVCDQCKLRCSFSHATSAVLFLRTHANCNFTGCRVVLERNPCPNRARDYVLSTEPHQRKK